MHRLVSDAAPIDDIALVVIRRSEAAATDRR
jgi:hypothetical protein